MLAVDSGHRKRKIGSTLVKRAIDAMIAEEADEVTKIKDCGSQQNLKFERNWKLNYFSKFSSIFCCLTKVSRFFFFDFKLRKN